MRTTQQNIATLPAECFGILPIDKSIIKIRAGESGYWPLTGLQESAQTICKNERGAGKDGFSTEDLADQLNAQDGITKAQRKAMEWGSQFGWDTPLANPDNYDGNGRPYSENNPKPAKHFVYNDGGRQSAGFKGKTGDCVTRAIAIATGIPYEEVYSKIHQLNTNHKTTRRDKLAKKLKKGGGTRGTTPRNGVSKQIYHPYLLSLGATWHPVMKIGQGCKMHLTKEELPKGTLIVRLSKHLCAVIDGVIQDTYDCSRGGKRCVYGYYIIPEKLYR